MARPLLLATPSRRGHPAPGAILLSLLLVTPLAPAGPARSETETEVRVERVRPKREKLATLQFLKQNRDFIRARFDLLRTSTRESRGDAAAIDPRYLAYSRMLAEILAAGDSIAASEDARQRLELLASITELGRLEAQLDLMDRTLADQRARLGILQEDFTGHQQTALIVVLSGYPRGAAIESLAVTLEDGARVAVTLSAERREALQRGGVLQVFHGFVEPREQILEVTLGGAGWPSGDVGYVPLDPARNRITLLRLDLSGAQPGAGASSIEARTWLHETHAGTTGG